MSASVHQVNALLNRLIQQEFRHTARTHGDGKNKDATSTNDRVQISDTARSQQPETTHLDEHLLALYTQRGRARP